LISIVVNKPANRAFDLTESMSSGSSIRTSTNGYFAYLYIGGISSIMITGSAPALSGMSMYLAVSYLSPNAVLLTFALSSQSDFDLSVDIIVLSDVNFKGNDVSPIDPLRSGRGFRLHYNDRELTFVCRGYPLVSNVTASDFDAYLFVSPWSQGNDVPWSSGDSAMAFSWQGVPPWPVLRCLGRWS
jgi:hypothetical protein